MIHVREAADETAEDDVDDMSACLARMFTWFAARCCCDASEMPVRTVVEPPRPFVLRLCKSLHAAVDCTRVVAVQNDRAPFAEAAVGAQFMAAEGRNEALKVRILQVVMQCRVRARLRRSR